MVRLQFISSVAEVKVFAALIDNMLATSPSERLSSSCFVLRSSISISIKESNLPPSDLQQQKDLDNKNTHTCLLSYSHGKVLTRHKADVD